MAKDYSKYTKEELIQHINELEIQLREHKYGLFWDKKIEREECILKCERQIPVLERDYSKSLIFGGEENNLLLEGDNFHSLTTLKMLANGGPVCDVIYIDPPYNTGHEDFAYNDHYIDKDDGYRHSKWLSFMEARLKIARELLADDGCIFISIDDNEQANLKLLCNQIFGESNFIANLVIETANGVFGTRASQVTKTFVKVKDYVLVYAKNKTVITRDFQPLYMPTNDLFDTHFSIMLDSEYNRINLLDFLKSNEDYKKFFEKYNMKIMLDNISKIMKIDSKFNDMILSLSDKIYQDVAFSLSLPIEIEQELKKGKTLQFKENIIFKTKNGLGTTRQYIPFKNSLHLTDDYFPEYRRAVAIGDLWEGFDADMKNVTKEGNIEFANGKKPVRLIKQLLKWNNVKNAVVLDFFAGSGTTGQSVLELNNEDGGNRRFILCQNNENNICTNVTYPRLKTIITGVKQDGYKYSDGISTNLIYYKTDYIEDSKNTDQAKYCLVEKVDELLCINEGIYNKVERNDYSSHYVSNDGTKHMFIYSDYYNEERFSAFRKKVLDSKGIKIVYIFSTDNNVDVTLFEEVKGIEIKPIPSKIYEIYKEIVEDIKRG